MNNGSRLWIISEEMSISMLTKPRIHTPVGMVAGDEDRRSTIIGTLSRSACCSGVAHGYDARIAGRHGCRHGSSRVLWDRLGASWTFSAGPCSPEWRF